MVANNPSANDPAIQARAVDQRFEDLLAKQGLQIEARDIQPPAVEHTIANAKIVPHQMTERHAASRQVAPVLVWRQCNAAVASECFQDLDFNQRHLTIDVGPLRVGAQPGCVAVTLDADALDQSRLGELRHGGRSRRCHVNVEQLALPHHPDLIRRNTFSRSPVARRVKRSSGFPDSPRYPFSAATSAAFLSAMPASADPRRVSTPSWTSCRS